MNSFEHYPHYPILVMDDDINAIKHTEIILNKHGFNHVFAFTEPKDFFEFLNHQNPSVILLDLVMPQKSGEEILAELLLNHPEIPIIILTSIKEIDKAIECIQLGAYDYLSKPVDVNRLMTSLKRAIELSELKEENRTLKQSIYKKNLKNPAHFDAIITQSPTMYHIFEYIESISMTQEPVLITGETGTGKELFAKAIHTSSSKEGDFIAVNVAGLDDHFFNDTLFGHEKGSYTGAQSKREGLIQKAQNGTLFLDEIGDLSMQSQVKLLRLLQEKEYFPIGGDQPKISNARIIIATHQNLKHLQENGQFRSDLYYRLLSHHLHIPALRERPEDISLLVEHFIDLASSQNKKSKPSYPDELLLILSNYNFPGNVRELESMIFDLVSSHSKGKLSLELIKKRIQTAPKNSQNSNSNYSQTSFWCSFDQFPTINEMTDFLIQEAMRRSSQNQVEASRILGIARQSLNRRLNKKTIKTSSNQQKESNHE